MNRQEHAHMTKLLQKGDVERSLEYLESFNFLDIYIPNRGGDKGGSWVESIGGDR